MAYVRITGNKINQRIENVERLYEKAEKSEENNYFY